MSHDHTHFDWNDIYTGQEKDREPPNPRFVAIIDTLEPGRALDVGCGAGGLVLALRERGWQVTGVDIAPRAIEAAGKVLAARGLDAELVVGDAAVWRPPGVYDLITNSFALPGTQVEQARLFRMARAALAPGGTILLEDFDACMTRHDAFSRFHCPTVEELVEAFAGFEIVRAEIVETPIHDHAPPEQQLEGPWTAVLFHARKSAA